MKRRANREEGGGGGKHETGEKRSRNERKEKGNETD